MTPWTGRTANEQALAYGKTGTRICTRQPGGDPILVLFVRKLLGTPTSIVSVGSYHTRCRRQCSAGSASGLPGSVYWCWKLDGCWANVFLSETTRMIEVHRGRRDWNVGCRVQVSWTQGCLLLVTVFSFFFFGPTPSPLIGWFYGPFFFRAVICDTVM